MKPLQALLALFACGLLPLRAASLGGLFLDLNFDGEITITDCDTTATGELVIPDTIDGFPITSIGSLAFSGCSSLTNITIGNRGFPRPFHQKQIPSSQTGEILDPRPI